MFDWFLTRYKTLLFYFEKHRWAAILLILAIAAALVHSMSLAKKIGSSMVSESDRGEIAVKLEFPTRYDLSRTETRLKEAVDLISAMPEIRHTLTTIGKVEGVLGQSSEGVYLAQVLLKFSERDQRKLTINDLQNEVRMRLSAYPDSIVTVSMPSVMGGQMSEVEMEIAGEDLATLDRLALKTEELAGEIPGLQDADTTVRAGKPELRIYPDRAVLSDLGYPATGLGMTLRANMEGVEAATFKQGDRTYDIVVKLEDMEGKDQIKNFLFPGTPGHSLHLTSLARIEEGLSPVQITRKDKRRVAKFFSNLAGNKPLGKAVAEIRAAIDEKEASPQVIITALPGNTRS